ncbi:regulatory LuxR family protein [Kribbella steppae]|uniref:Regulatory LuxR family protein n=1 Tax=Kribbella steppae TaxID=2512223 RepID=A0A4V6NMY2_9ACTN|nr:LuxR family transcriptional regulator [Kribbella steppae]TCO19737.1 regulatory LuxR family protein [Kribbella steppae]
MITVLPASAELVGRTAELELIDSMLDGQSGTGLLLRGCPGVGKTALLDAAAARAGSAGARVLRVCGVEFESDIDFSALHQLLYPLRDHVDQLAGHHRDTLHRVFDLAPEPSLHPLAASTAVLAMLSKLAQEGPLLVLADDLPWIDKASAIALGFAARRLGYDPILFLATARTAADGFCDRVGLPERVIGPLATKAASKLLDAQWPGLAPTVRRRLLTEADGNPLALRDLAAGLTDRQRSGQDPLPRFLPVTGRLKETVAHALDTLPAPTRKMLLLAALDKSARLTTIEAAALGDARTDDLAAATQAAMVHVDHAADRVSFRHPLIRSAIVNLTPATERRVAHEALAALTDDPVRRAWHMAEAATGPDEAVARALDEAALSAWRRGDRPGAADQAADELPASDRRRRGASAAVTLLVRAGELSPDPNDRSRRLVEAAYLAGLSGQLDQVDRLLADAGHPQDTPTGLVFAATAHLLTNEGDVDSAYRLLARALDDVADTAKPSGWDHHAILYTLLLASLYTLRPEPWELLNKALARFDPDTVTAFRLCHDAYVDPTRTSDNIRAGLARAFDDLPPDPAPWQLIPLAFAAVAMDAMSDYRHVVRHMIDRERDGGAIAMAIPGLMLLSHDSHVRGQWDEAKKLSQEGLDLATAYGYHFWEAQIRALQAAGAARRGDVDLALAHSKQTTSWAAPRRIEVARAYAHSARHLAAIGQGDFDEAHLQISQIDALGVPSPGVPGRWVILDQVEAAVLTGRMDEARGHVAAAEQAGMAGIGPRIELIVAGAAAIAAEETEAGPLFEAALELPEADRWPWEHARIHLAYGRWLRRTRDTGRARLHIRAALETFERIGAAAMAQQARSELRATGIATTSRPDTPTIPLTAQERQIAELAATGLTNKQIGARLYLSHRTVGSHLHRLYPKLGIASRAALRSALETITDGVDVGR